MKLTDIYTNPDNPREITESAFEKLKGNIKRRPNFLKYRPIIIDKNNVIIAGNMRYKALQELGMDDIPDEYIRCADDLTDEERREFIILDNVEAGTFDWDIVTSNYTTLELLDWGVDIPVQPIPEAESDIPPISHSFKIKCDNLDELIELRELLNADVNSQSMSFSNFKKTLDL